MNKLFAWVRRKPGTVIILLLLLFVPFLNYTGFCYSKFRYFNEQQLIDNYLFKEKATTLTEQQKIDATEKIGGEYPNCCRLTGEQIEFSRDKRLSNKIIGWYRFQLVTYFRQKPVIEKKNPYYEDYISISSCGDDSYEDYGMSLSEKHYKIKIQSNNKYWEGKLK